MGSVLSTRPGSEDRGVRSAGARTRTALLMLGWIGASTPAMAATCEASAGPTAPTLVELYTSEGCSSCPPADRWLSTLTRRSDVLALAFHVSYWDRLGWADRFAQGAFTDRQRSLMAHSGARYVYTPQVVVNGKDWRGWPALPSDANAAPADLRLSRDGDTVTARIRLRGDAAERKGERWTGYWAVLEDGHRSDVRAGENAGATLRHDHVVRHYQPVGGWSADGEQRWTWQLPAKAPQGIGQRIAFVVVDAATQRPLQALALAC